jgi:signal peptidase II
MRIVILTLFSICCYVFDYITKRQVETTMTLHQSINVIGEYLKWTYIRNPNGVFGIKLGPFGGNYFAFMSVALLIVLLIIYRREILKSNLIGLAFAFIIGGAAGNLTDRFLYGEVVDFIQMGIPGGPYWPIYNIADLVVVIGMILLIIYFAREEGSRKTRPEINPTQADHQSIGESSSHPSG